MNRTAKRYVLAGETVTVELPHSEVCMHMKVAGKVMRVKLTDSGGAQLLNETGGNFSFPITAGEAGFYHDDGGTYFYPPEMRFTLTARWVTGGGQRSEYGQEEMQSELAALARVLDGMAPGDTMTVERIR